MNPAVASVSSTETARESSVTANAAATATTTTVIRSLDELLDLRPAELEALYRNARVPKLADVRGDCRGRLLALPAFGPVLGGVARALAGTTWFPWRGKSFAFLGSGRGEGINRVVADRLKLFRFETFVGKSRAGDFDAVQLDYDNAGNPFFIRAIKDEIREIAPGLYLGQAYVVAGKTTTLALYFGLELPAASRN